jgi:hypothetical protein
MPFFHFLQGMDWGTKPGKMPRLPIGSRFEKLIFFRSRFLAIYMKLIAKYWLNTFFLSVREISIPGKAFSSLLDERLP